MSNPSAAQSRAVAPPAPARERVRATLSQRHHVEMITLLFILMAIQTLAELHFYIALAVSSPLLIGLRDIVVILLFAEEEGFLQ